MFDWREKHEVIQFQTDDYDATGYNLLKNEYGLYAIGVIGHCSCYGTWAYKYEDVEGERKPDGLTVEWEGTRDGLLAMARGTLDPSMPERQAVPDDYKFCYLKDLYDWILKGNV